MSHGDAETTVAELQELVVRFRDERNWQKHHTPKNLAISIMLEAAELLEHFQWDEYGEEDRQAITDELADILKYAFIFADAYNLDISTAFREKLDRDKQKYPLELFNKDRDGAEDYTKIKKRSRGK